MGVTQQTIAQYESLDNTPKQASLDRIAKALEVNLWEWLIDANIDGPYKKTNPDTQIIEKIMRDYNALNDIGKAEVQKRVHELTFVPEYKREE